MDDIYSDEIIKKYRKKNWSEAIEDFVIKKKYIMTKIENIAENYGMNETEVYNIIYNSKDEELKNLFIAVRLAKDPTRQNIFENIFYDFMKENGRDIEKLPASGSNSLILTKHSISKGTSDDQDTTKSLDFMEKIGKKTIYYYHKYTKDEGGAQDNQYNDLQTFVKIANKYCKNNKDNTCFVAVADGPYYNKERKNYLASLAGEYLDNRIFIVSWNTLLNAVK